MGLVFLLCAVKAETAGKNGKIGLSLSPPVLPTTVTARVPSFAGKVLRQNFEV